MRSPRPSPSFVVAVLALVLAAGGTGYAAGKVSSQQIKDGTVQGRDIRNSTITGADVRNNSLTGAELKNGSVPRAKLGKSCAPGESALFGGCVRRASSEDNSSYLGAVDDCNRRIGRLPTISELKWIAANTAEFAWADGNVSNYEFTGATTTASPFTPIAFDRTGLAITDASGQFFWHHCVTY